MAMMDFIAFPAVGYRGGMRRMGRVRGGGMMRGGGGDRDGCGRMDLGMRVATLIVVLFFGVDLCIRPRDVGLLQRVVVVVVVVPNLLLRLLVADIDAASPLNYSRWDLYHIFAGCQFDVVENAYDDRVFDVETSVLDYS